MRVVLIGPPGAGKGTQAAYIAKKFGIPQISTGNILRSEVASGSELGNKIKKIMDGGDLVSDNIILKIVKKRMSDSDCKNGFLLDGFPRTKEQAIAAFNMGIKIDKVIEIKVPDPEIVTRLSGRRIHLASGRTYHITSNPPKIDGRDDETNEELTIREDDQTEAVINRLANYHSQTSPLVTWFKESADKHNFVFCEIDGLGSVEEVNNKIEQLF